MWQVVCGLQTKILKIMNQEDLARVGNMKHRAEFNRTSERVCSPGCLRATGLSSDHRVALEQGVVFSASPSSMLTRIEALPFRVLVCAASSSIPLPLSQCICGCGLSIDPLGHHHAACSRTGALGRRGFALESALARVCREAGGRVATNLFVLNIDLGVPRVGDNRRLEVVVDGLAVDTMLVSALEGEWRAARRIKERTCPELLDPGPQGTSCGVCS